MYGHAKVSAWAVWYTCLYRAFALRIFHELPLESRFKIMIKLVNRHFCIWPDLVLSC